MPFVSISRPAIGISILKSVLERRGIRCDLADANLRFAEGVGFDTYSILDERVSDALFAGDWLFAQHLFGDELDLPVYIETLESERRSGGARRRSWPRGRTSGRSCRRASKNIRIADYDIVGFTTTFEQNLASLALARLVKETWPEKVDRVRGGKLRGGDGARAP